MAVVRDGEADPSVLGGYRSPRGSWARAMHRNFVGFGVLLLLGAAYESLYVFGVLPLSILEPMWLFTPQTLSVLAVLGLVAGAWLVLKGSRGFGDMGLTSRAIITPGRTVRQVLRGVPGLLPLNQVVGIRVLAKSSPSKIEIRYRMDSGQERRLALPLACVANPDEFVAGLSDRGIRVERDP